MKKIFKNKYYLFIMLVLVAAFNAILFISTGKTNLELSSFWVNYAFVMLFWLVLILPAFLKYDNKTHQGLFLIFLTPVSLLALVVGIIFFFFITKISVTVIVIINILFIVLAVIGLLLRSYYQSHLKTVPKKEVKLFDLTELKEALLGLMKLTADQVCVKTLQSLVEMSNNINFSIKNEQLDARIIEIVGFMENDLKENDKNNFLNNAKNMEKLLNQRGN